ncbi:MAG: hypothetical protein MZV65_25755 [Chromatiales bacterium]|nr:hypothetical protein [Chromatiales bacterium]
MASYALRLPESLFACARQVAEEERVSMNLFFFTAIAEKVSALKTEAYFRERRARERPGRVRCLARGRVTDVPARGRGIDSTRCFRGYGNGVGGVAVALEFAPYHQGSWSDAANCDQRPVRAITEGGDAVFLRDAGARHETTR